MGPAKQIPAVYALHIGGWVGPVVRYRYEVMVQEQGHVTNFGHANAPKTTHCKPL